MRRAWRVACLALAVALAAPAGASLPVKGAATVKQQLAAVTVLRGRFEQEKQVVGFRNTLRSSGDFVISRDHGVVWNTTAPFASTIVLTPRQISLRQGNGQRQTVPGGQGGRAAATVNSLMLALMTGDIDTLERHFRAETTTVPGKGWTLVLVPKDAALKKVFARIAMQGASHVQAVTLYEASGDRTDLRFLDLRDTPATLTPAEAARFE